MIGLLQGHAKVGPDMCILILPTNLEVGGRENKYTTSPPAYIHDVNISVFRGAWGLRPGAHSSDPPLMQPALVSSFSASLPCVLIILSVIIIRVNPLHPNSCLRVCAGDYPKQGKVKFMHPVQRGTKISTLFIFP